MHDQILFKILPSHPVFKNLKLQFYQFYKSLKFEFPLWQKRIYDSFTIRTLHPILLRWLNEWKLQNT
jgi:hypothetical protein